MPRFPHVFAPILALMLCLALAACGLKGPPLPPLAATPEESERIAARASPRPSPSPAAAAAKRKTGRKKNTSNSPPETR
jgi:predicted small lipoprotein YifL